MSCAVTKEDRIRVVRSILNAIERNIVAIAFQENSLKNTKRNYGIIYYNTTNTQNNIFSANSVGLELYGLNSFRAWVYLKETGQTYQAVGSTAKKAILNLIHLHCDDAIKI